MNQIRLNPKYTARTVGDSVYHSLRDEILTLKLKPGEELNIQDVANSLGISRSPVRDALMRLASDSLVDIFPQRGCRVSLIDFERVEQERFLREGIEMLALSQFMKVVTAQDIDLMEHALILQKHDIEQREFARLISHDEDFHAVFFDAINQDYARQILETSCVHYRRIRLLSFYYSSFASDMIDQHEALLEAIRAHDIAQCMSLEKEHLKHLDAQQTEMVERNPEYFINE